MLGFVRRSCFGVKNPRVRKSMYVTLERGRLAYCSQVWAPQSVKLIYSVERIQGIATKVILSLPFRSEVSYKNRFLNLNLIPLCYWHEYLDLVYIFENTSNDSNIPINVPARFTRRTDPSLCHSQCNKF